MAKNLQLETSRELEALLEPGTSNKVLNDFLYSNEDEISDSGFYLPSKQAKCNLCCVNDYPFSIGESIFFENDEYVIVEAAGKKSHDIRNMIIFNDHSYVPSVDEMIKKEYGKGLTKLVDYSRQDNSVVVYGSLNTFHHPHLICSDVKPGDLPQSGFQEINNYLMFESGESIETADGFYGDKLGEMFLGRVYDAALNEAQ